MKKNYRAKFQGEFDVIQLTKDNYDEVVAFIKQADKHVVFDKEFFYGAVAILIFFLIFLKIDKKTTIKESEKHLIESLKSMDL